MTIEEAAFAAAITAAPHDLTARGEFADWLQERDRDRAEADGWAALSLWNYAPFRSPDRGTHEWWNASHRDYDPLDNSDIPEDWFNSLEGGVWWPEGSEVAHSRDYTSEGMAVVAAARAFARLPPDRRAELLRGPAGA